MMQTRGLSKKIPSDTVKSCFYKELNMSSGRLRSKCKSNTFVFIYGKWIAPQQLLLGSSRARCRRLPLLQLHLYTYRNGFFGSFIPPFMNSCNGVDILISLAQCLSPPFMKWPTGVSSWSSLLLPFVLPSRGHPVSLLVGSREGS